MPLFGGKKNGNKEEGLVNQEDLSIPMGNEEVEADVTLEDTDLTLRESENESSDEGYVETNSNQQGEGSGEFGFEQFIQTFKEGKQEEVILSEDAIKHIKEDIVIGHVKAKFRWGTLVWGFIFVIIIAISIFTAYVFANYSMVWDYNVAEAEYYFEKPIKLSVTPKNSYCDTRYLEPNMNVLYSNEDVGFFTKFKKFRIKEINYNGPTVFGYDYETKSFITITKESIYYIIDEELEDIDDGVFGIDSDNNIDTSKTSAVMH